MRSKHEGLGNHRVLTTGAGVPRRLNENQRAYMKKVFMDFYEENMTSPYVATERGYLDAMIQPSETRLTLRRALRQLATKYDQDLPKKHAIRPL